MPLPGKQQKKLSAIRKKNYVTTSPALLSSFRLGYHSEHAYWVSSVSAKLDDMYRRKMEKNWYRIWRWLVVKHMGHPTDDTHPTITSPSTRWAGISVFYWFNTTNINTTTTTKNQLKKSLNYFKQFLPALSLLFFLLFSHLSFASSS